MNVKMVMEMMRVGRSMRPDIRDEEGRMSNGGDGHATIGGDSRKVIRREVISRDQPLSLATSLCGKRGTSGLRGRYYLS